MCHRQSLRRRGRLRGGLCDAGSCATASCNDGSKDGDESDIDCGGSCAKKCVNAGGCNSGSDCISCACSLALCTSCSLPSDCYPANGAALCRVYACTNGACVIGNLGTDAMLTQTVGDCQDVQCDGSGNVIMKANANDPPDDGDTHDCQHNQCIACQTP